MIEIWKDVEDYEGHYQVSNTGKVKSIKKRHMILKMNKHDRYAMVALCKNGKKKTVRIHRLVAQAFLPNPENKPQVNHKDGNKLNNNVDNIEWVTARRNMHHAYDTGLVDLDARIKALNLSSIAARKIVIQYDMNMNKVNQFISVAEAYRKTNVDRRHISRVCLNGRKSAGGYIWRYKQ